MKTKLVNALTGSVITAAMLFALPALANKAPQVEALKKSLKAVPVLEMPAKAAQLVTEAKAEERESVALAVVVAAAQVKPAAIASVVSAIIRVVPEMAASLAATAAAQLPKQADAITQAAVAAAPGRADKIISAVSQQAPAKYAEAVPQAMSSQGAGSGGRVAAPMAAPPTPGNPFTPPPNSPTEIGRGSTVVVQPGGGRDYATP